MMKKRFLALALAAAMVFSVLPQNTIMSNATELATSSEETSIEDEVLELLSEEASADETILDDGCENATIEQPASTADYVDEDEALSADSIEESAPSTESAEIASSVDAIEEDATEELNGNSALTLRVEYDANAVSIVARNGANAVTATTSGSGESAYKEFSVTSGDTIGIIVTALENSTISNAIFTDGDAAEKTLKASSTKSCEFSVKPTASSSTLTVNAVESNKAVLYQGSTLVSPKSKVYSLALATSYTAKIQHGSAEYLSIASFKAMAGKTEITSEIATLSSDKKFVTINFAKTSAYAGKAVTLTLTDSESKSYSYSLKSQVPVTSVTLAGIKNNKITAIAGQKKTIKVSVNSGANASDLSATFSFESDDYDGYTPSKLTTVSYSDGLLDIEPGALGGTGTITFKYNGNTVATFNLTVSDNISSYAPSISAVSTSDTSATFKLALNKNFKYANISSNVSAYYILYYFNESADFSGIDLDADDAFNQLIEAGIVSTTKVAVTGASQTYCLNLSAKKLESTTTPETFYVMADMSLNIVSEDDVVSCENGTNSTNAIVVKTKKPAYETKLTLNQTRTTLYSGEELVTIATAKFSKATTYTTLQDVEIENTATGYDASDITLYLSSDRQSILASTTSDAAPGKYKITAYAKSPANGQDVTATIYVTIPKEALSASLTASDSVYKKAGKAATLKTTLTCTDYNDAVVKPNKVTYTVSASGQLQNKISVNKNGVVTIAKDYLVDSDNSFTVTANVTGKGGLTLSSSFSATVKSTGIGFYKMTLSRGGIKWTKDSGACSVTGAQASGSLISLYDASGSKISSNDYTLNGSNCVISNQTKNNQVYSYVYLSKNVKTFSITATAKDGSGESIKAIFNVTPSTGAITLYDSDSNVSLDNSAKTLTFTTPAATFLTVKIGGYSASVLENVSMSCETGMLISQKYALEHYYTKLKKYITPSYDILKLSEIANWTYVPKAATDTITITYNGTSVSYTVTNNVESYESSGATVSSDNVNIYYTDNYYISKAAISLSGLGSDSSDYDYMVDFDYAEALSPSKYSTTAVNGSFLQTYWDDLDNNTVELGDITLSSSITSYPKLSAASYTMYIYLRKSVNGTYTYYAPIPITVNMKKLNSTSVTSFPSKISISSKTSSTVDISSNVKVKEGTVTFTGMKNMNISGTYNSFNDYFSIQENGTIVVKKSLDGIDKNNLTGYIQYTLTDNAGNTSYHLAKVTMTVLSK